MRGLIQARLRRAATPPRQRSLTVVLAGVILAALLLPATALANHIFSDVPTGMTGHAAIEAIYDAGITGGCGGTRYCPTDAVTRAQMALFMQRGFPRVSYAPGPDEVILEQDPAPVNGIAIRTGGGAGRTQFVKVDAGVNLVVNDATDCPCDVTAAIVSSEGDVSLPQIVTVDTAGRWSTIPLTLAIAAPTNTDLTFTVLAEFDPDGGAPVIAAYADLTVITAPFGASGTDILGEAPTRVSGPKAKVDLEPYRAFSP